MFLEEAFIKFPCVDEPKKSLPHLLRKFHVCLALNCLNVVVLHHGPEDGGGGSEDVLVAGNLVAIEDQGEICPLHIVSFAGVGWTDGPLCSLNSRADRRRI